MGTSRKRRQKVSDDGKSAEVKGKLLGYDFNVASDPGLWGVISLLAAWPSHDVGRESAMRRL